VPFHFFKFCHFIYSNIFKKFYLNVFFCIASTITGDLFLIVYGVDSRESFDEARRLQDQVFLAKGGHQQATSAGIGVRAARAPYVPHVIVGNKTDRDSERAVEPGELKALVDRYPNCCGAVETSAKRNQNVDEVRIAAITSATAALEQCKRP